ncbi:vomeronasal type-2 receptor 26-like [Hyperolius riggenbachi]|uniref:vomeronasal type-2 receptor 26-like n=1 Tax=Hyperolius riggenbachi TaxID=752182 RepID=UPI0035A364B8
MTDASHMIRNQANGSRECAAVMHRGDQQHWSRFNAIKYCKELENKQNPGVIGEQTESIYYKGSCMKCPEDQWPNDENQCVPKQVEFLSYNNDPIILVLCSVTALLFVKSSVILGMFIIYRDTAVIKANNNNLSFLLLTCIMLTFLCVFLFIGRPVHATCMVRHTLYGVILSTAISSILAKTLMVYAAFKAIKPGSSWRKFLGVKISNCVVFTCSFIQILVSLFWLSISPPFPESNFELYQDKIVIQCNEGSPLAFSILLGYMGLLAAVSFMVAFLARNLPDSFNEAKYITFSMLVFCSVWITFIPAYMSATGKSAVLVEIFAIISSSVGILGLIFLPKCYIILISYGATDPILTNKQLYPSFFQTLPSDHIQYLVIIKLLKHFSWTWIGIIASDEDAGVKQSQVLQKMAAVYDICIEFITYIHDRGERAKQKEIIDKSTSKVLVFCSVTLSAICFIGLDCNDHNDKTFILSVGLVAYILLSSNPKGFWHGSLAFLPTKRKIPQLQRFLENVSLANRPNDIILEHILAMYFNCLTSNQILNAAIAEELGLNLHKCSNTKRLSDLSNKLFYTQEFGTTYDVYKALYAMAHSLHEMRLYLSRNPGKDHLRHNKNLHKIPTSICSEDCPKGYRRALKKGLHHCCFDCIQCLDGEISSESDKGYCVKCPEDQWPNDHNQCVPKQVEFLSYNNDPISLVLCSVTAFLFVKSSVILGMFIIYRDTAVIKANNNNLSFLLLTCIMLTFICVFLFIGRPVHATCIVRHTLYGIIFSIAISSILAKTLMVYAAFKAIKPGSSWRKVIGVKIPNFVVFTCSLIQILVSLFWLSISPPFPENNFDLYQDKIVIQCNEGSPLAFSLLLGYMGLLAAVSFMVAFLARNLPDSFNEAKYITFSMLVFCSVWITFIPAYMSATGKSAVLVEIFAILSSSVGILGLIFLPKCYIILMRPDLNAKNLLLKHCH